MTGTGYTKESERKNADVAVRFWRTIQRVCDEQGISDQELALRTHIGECVVRTGLYNLRTGKGKVTFPSLTHAALICSYLSISIDSAVYPEDYVVRNPLRENNKRLEALWNAPEHKERTDFCRLLPSMDFNAIGMIHSAISVTFGHRKTIPALGNRPSVAFADSMSTYRRPAEKFEKVVRRTQSLIISDLDEMHTEYLGGMFSASELPVFANRFFLFMFYVIAAYRGISLYQLAKIIKHDIAFGSLSGWQRLDRAITLNKAISLAAALGLSIDFLIYEFPRLENAFRKKLIGTVFSEDVKQMAAPYAFINFAEDEDIQDMLAMDMVCISNDLTNIATAVFDMDETEFRSFHSDIFQMIPRTIRTQKLDINNNQKQLDAFNRLGWWK